MADGDGQDKWNELLQEADIYEVIDRAILVAAAKSPREFLGRRDGITLRLYTVAAPPPPATAAAAPVPVSSPRNPANATAVDGQGSTPRASSEKRSKVASCNGTPGDGDGNNERSNGGVRGSSDKHSKVAASCNGTPGGDEDNNDDDERLRHGVASVDDGRGHDNGNTADDEEENLQFADNMLQNLADQIEQDKQEINELLRIKDILVNYRKQSTSILLESLRRLRLMELSMEKLKNTEIGRAVSALSKHKSRDIRQLVRDLIMAWRAVVDEWIVATEATIADKNTESNPSAIEDEHRLLTPPTDAGAILFTTEVPTVQHISEFLNGIDDDGNVISGIGSNDSLGNKKQNKITRTSNHAPAGMRRQQPAQAYFPNGDVKSLPMNQDLPTRQEFPLRQTKPHITQHISHADGNTLSMRQILPTGQGPPLRQTNPQKLVSAGENTVLQRQGLPARQEPTLRQTNLEKTQESRSPLKPRHKIIIKLKHSGTKYDQPRRLFEENPEKKSCVQMKPKPTPVAAARNPPLPIAVERKPLSRYMNSFDGTDGDRNVISRDLSNVGLGNKNQKNSVRTSKHTPRLWKQQISQDFPNADEETLFMEQDLPARREPPLRRTKPHIPLADGNTLPMRKVLPTEQWPPLRQTDPQRIANAGQRYVLQRRGLPATQGTALVRQTNPEKTQGPRSPLKHPRIIIKLKRSGAEHDYEPRRLFEETPAKKKRQVPCAIARSPSIAGAAKPTVAVARKPLSDHVNKPAMPVRPLAGPGTDKRKIQQADMRLERTKRRLHEAYQEAENAKKQRSVQLVELPVVPKYKQISKIPLVKPRKEKDRIRPWVPNIRFG